MVEESNLCVATVIQSKAGIKPATRDRSLTELTIHGAGTDDSNIGLTLWYRVVRRTLIPQVATDAILPYPKHLGAIQILVGAGSDRPFGMKELRQVRGWLVTTGGSNWKRPISLSPFRHSAGVCDLAQPVC